MFLKKPICPFPPESPEAAYIQILTPYAFNLLKPHLDSYRHVRIFQEVDDIACEFVTNVGRIVTTFDACPCVFRMSTGLPCRHIMAVRHVKNVTIFERQLVPDRWTRTYNASFHTDTIVITPSADVQSAADDQVYNNGADQRHLTAAAPAAAAVAKPDRTKTLSSHQKYKRAVAITNELASLAAEAPLSLYLARLQHIKELRDAWRTERPSPELLLGSGGGIGEAMSKDEDLAGVFAADELVPAAGGVRIGGEDVVAVGVCETELVDIANSVDSAMVGSWIGGVENAMRYSDIKLPSKVAKRGRPSGVGKSASVGLPKKRVKV